MSKRRVLLYTKAGCHLCEEAKMVMLGAGCDSEFELEEIDIRSDSELYERFKHDIPVVEIDGVEAFRHRVSAEEFRKKIRAEPKLQ